MLAIEPGTTPDGVLSASYYFRFYLAALSTMPACGRVPGLNRPLAQDAGAPLQHLAGGSRQYALRLSRLERPSHLRLLTLVAASSLPAPASPRPHSAPPGALPSLTATYPHPEGLIKVDYRRQRTSLDATVTLPGKLTGSFIFAARTGRSIRRQHHPRSP